MSNSLTIKDILNITLQDLVNIHGTSAVSIALSNTIHIPSFDVDTEEVKLTKGKANTKVL